MAYRCDKCGKRKVYSSSQKHKKGVAGGKWKHRAPKTPRINLPNLHSFNGYLDNVKGKWKLCTKCLRRAKVSHLELLKKLEAKKAVKAADKSSIKKTPAKKTKKSRQ